ncbi:MAG: 2-iminobutanoate/2-iminopropanoate deaminase [Rhodothermales bacterium]|jgi:2-iminobutanoate/2-iminopropanoate deaminase
MPLSAIATDSAPAAVGPYSQAIAANGFLFVSGQLPINPENGELVSGDIAAATDQALANIGAILHAAGIGFEAVVKTEVFLKDIGDFATMNARYANAFTGPVLPARQAIEASALPKSADIEISCIAVLG